MTQSKNTPETPPEETVGRLLDALASGRVLDALDAFAMDAVIQDARGEEYRGDPRDRRVREPPTTRIHTGGRHREAAGHRDGDRPIASWREGGASAAYVHPRRWPGAESTDRGGRETPPRGLCVPLRYGKRRGGDQAGT